MLPLFQLTRYARCSLTLAALAPRYARRSASHSSVVLGAAQPDTKLAYSIKLYDSALASLRSARQLAAARCRQNLPPARTHSVRAR